MYRVYDNLKKKWVEDNIYMSPNGDLYKIKKSIFGFTKIPLFEDRYIWHRSINLWDKHNVDIYEGDYLKIQVSENRTAIGLVVYAAELSSYIALIESTQEFFTLGSDIYEFIEVIGNVFDGYEVNKDGGNETL